MNKICIVCGKEISRHSRCGKRDWDKRKFCSVSCYHLSVDNIPSDIWKRIDKRSEDECWEWKGAVSTNGYGAMSINCKDDSTHRIVYCEIFGTIPEGLFVLHHCDNPSCCNPNHLFLGTPKDNMKDRNQKGRGNVPRGEEHYRSKLIKEQVLEIRKLYITNEYTQTKLGKMFGVAPSNISNIINRKAWRHI